MFPLAFAFYMIVGIVGYAGWGDPINWGFLVPVAFLAALFTKRVCD